MKMESLVLQKEYLRVLSKRHMLWIDGEENFDVNRLYLACLGLIHQLQEKYQSILDLHESPENKD